jgi:hypothetical protein
MPFSGVMKILLQEPPRCSKCVNPARPGQKYCKACHAESMRLFRLRQSIKIQLMKARLDALEAERAAS